MDDTPNAAPERTWTAQDASTRFDEVIEEALSGGPQRIVRAGAEAVIVVSEHDWRRLREAKPKMTFGELLAAFPLTAEEWQEVAPDRHRRRPTPFDDL